MSAMDKISFYIQKLLPSHLRDENGDHFWVPIVSCPTIYPAMKPSFVTFLSPLQLELNGMPIEDGTTSMDQTFLMHVMDLNDSLDGIETEDDLREFMPSVEGESGCHFLLFSEFWVAINNGVCYSWHPGTVFVSI